MCAPLAIFGINRVGSEILDRPRAAIPQRIDGVLDRCDTEVACNVISGTRRNDGKLEVGKIAFHQGRYDLADRAVASDGGEGVVTVRGHRDLPSMPGPLGDDDVFGIDRLGPGLSESSSRLSARPTVTGGIDDVQHVAHRLIACSTAIL